MANIPEDSTLVKEATSTLLRVGKLLRQGNLQTRNEAVMDLMKAQERVLTANKEIDEAIKYLTAMKNVQTDLGKILAEYEREIRKGATVNERNIVKHIKDHIRAPLRTLKMSIELQLKKL